MSKLQNSHTPTLTHKYTHNNPQQEEIRSLRTLSSLQIESSHKYRLEKLLPHSPTQSTKKLFFFKEKQEKLKSQNSNIKKRF